MLFTTLILDIEDDIQEQRIERLPDYHCSVHSVRSLPSALHGVVSIFSHCPATMFLNFFIKGTAFFSSRYPSPCCLLKTSCPSYLITRFLVTPGLTFSTEALGNTVLMTSAAQAASGYPPQDPQQMTSALKAVWSFGISLSSCGIELAPPIEYIQIQAIRQFQCYLNKSISVINSKLSLDIDLGPHQQQILSFDCQKLMLVQLRKSADLAFFASGVTNPPELQLVGQLDEALGLPFAAITIGEVAPLQQDYERGRTGEDLSHAQESLNFMRLHVYQCKIEDHLSGNHSVYSLHPNRLKLLSVVSRAVVYVRMACIIGIDLQFKLFCPRSSCQPEGSGSLLQSVEVYTFDEHPIADTGGLKHVKSSRGGQS